MRENESKLKRRILRLFIVVAILLLLFFIALAITWRVIKAENGITYDKMNFVFPSYVSFENMAWDVPDLTQGSADRVILDWQWAGLAARRINITQFELEGARIWVSISDSSSGSAEIPDIQIQKLDLSDVEVGYANLQDSLHLNLPKLTLREASIKSNTEAIQYDLLAFDQLTVHYSSDSALFTNDTLPLSLHSSDFSSSQEKGSYHLNQLALAIADLEIKARQIAFDPAKNNQATFTFEPSFGTIQDILWLYPDFETIIHPDYPRTSELVFRGGLEFTPDSMRFNDFEIQIVEETKAKFTGSISWADESIPIDLMFSNLHTTRSDLNAFLMPESYNSMFQWPSRAVRPRIIATKAGATENE